MNDREIDYEKIENSIKSLQSDLTRISLPYEDALSFRVFDNARKKMTIFLSILGGITIVGVAFFTFNIYTMAETKVSDYIEKKLIPSLDMQGQNQLKNLKNQGQKQLEKNMGQINLEMQTVLDSQILDVTKRIESKADIRLKELLKEIGNSLNDKKFARSTQKIIEKAVEKKKKSFVDGWSLFGIKNADDTWKKQIFLIADSQEKNSSAIPVKEDMVKVITNVNLRSDLPKYLDKLGWVLAPIKSIINYGEVVRVQEVENIPTPEGGKYIWVKISRK